MSTSRNYNESSPAPSTASASVSREPPSSPSKNDGALRLTVKMQPSKLRAATTSGARSGGTRGVAQKVTKKKVRMEEDFEPAEILESKRKRAKKNYVVDSESDEDQDMDDDVEEESAIEDEMDLDAEEDAEGEDDEMELPPPPPIIKSKTGGNNKPVIAVKPQPAKKEVRPVETKQMAASSDDDELSELDSDMADETMMNEEDDEEIEVEDEEEEEDEEDDDSDMGGSRASTPDLSKLTKRQRARLEEGGSGYLLALPDEVQVKKHLTAEEHAMRRAEMARRRKNLSEKRNEEEKMETINKLLKKQAPKTNKRRAELAGGGGADAAVDGEPAKPSPVFVRWVNNKEGSGVSVTSEYLESPVGAVFQGGVKAGKMVEEVQ